MSLRHALTFEPRRLVEVLVDFVLICTSFLLAYLMVVGGKGSVQQRSVFLGALPVVLGMRYVVFVAFRIYRRVWRYAAARDALVIALAIGISEILALGVIVATRPLGGFPLRVFLVDAVVCTALVTSSRLVLRILPELSVARKRGARQRIVVVGAGRAGRSLVRELREDGAAKVVAFVDDNPALRGRSVQGVPVVGTTQEMAAVITTARAAEVLVSIPNAPGDRLDPVVQACEAAAVPCRFVHRHTETMSPRLKAAAE
jgi:UDP-GlcNAc:undecaprenyl-phosphate GlcNAc-1-phosphate transferase